MKKKSIIVICMIAIALLGLVTIFSSRSSEKSSKVLEELYSYKGYTRVVSEEEFEFYRYFVERDLQGSASEKDINEKVKEYADKVNAVFYLGSKLGLGEPYSFELLKLRMEQENESRKLKQENGEIIYGLEQFSLENFYQYTLDNLETKIHQYLEANVDEGILELAKEYYEKNRDLFKFRECVIYELINEDETEILSADGVALSALGKSDMLLADFLYAGKIGDTYEYIQDGKKRTVVIKEIVYGKEGFKNNQEIILYQYIRSDLFDMIIEKIAENNPLEYESN